MRDGKLDFVEFVCLVHLVTCLLRGAQLTSPLPMQLTQSLQRLEPLEMLAQEREQSRSRSASPAPEPLEFRSAFDAQPEPTAAAFGADFATRDFAQDFGAQEASAEGFGDFGADFGAQDFAQDVAGELAAGDFGDAFGGQQDFGDFPEALEGEKKKGKKEKKEKKEKKKAGCLETCFRVMSHGEAETRTRKRRVTPRSLLRQWHSTPRPLRLPGSQRRSPALPPTPSERQTLMSWM